MTADCKHLPLLLLGDCAILDFVKLSACRWQKETLDRSWSLTLQRLTLLAMTRSKALLEMRLWVL